MIFSSSVRVPLHQFVVLHALLDQAVNTARTSFFWAGRIAWYSLA